jgi:deoxyribonuclease V
MNYFLPDKTITKPAQPDWGKNRAAAFHVPQSGAEAIAIQHALRQYVVLRALAENNLKVVVGVDVSFADQGNLSRAIITVFDWPSLKITHSVQAILPTIFPYISGLLSFRELPVILTGLSDLKTAPDLIFVDGQGIAHPRRLGIAAHLGVQLNVPTIGVAKSRLCGKYAEPGIEAGSASPLLDKGERIGTVLRSKRGCNPLFISPGHLCDQDDALRYVTRALRGYRLPEPTRIADKISKIKLVQA